MSMIGSFKCRIWSPTPFPKQNRFVQIIPPILFFLSLSHMIGANSPLKYAFPGPTLNPNPFPTRSRFPCFALGFPSSDLNNKLSVGRTKMVFLQKMRGGWSMIGRSDDLTLVDDAGGQDSFDDKASPEHLVIMVNGINGSAADWRYGADQFIKKRPDKLLVHCSKCNYSTLTFDGVDTMGKRLAEEVRSVVKDNSNVVKKISFVAHSLGGLVARYAIGKLYEPVSKAEHHNGDKENTNNLTQYLEQPYHGTIAGLEPMNFVTVATPHLGSNGHKQLPFLCGLPFLERRARETAHLLVGRSGKHLFLTDNDKDKPLLLRMVNDTDDLKFISALRAFKRRVAYANANYDRILMGMIIEGI